MKLTRCTIGAFGFSTLHFHNAPHLLASASCSKVVPGFKFSNEYLLAEMEKQQHKNLKLEFIALRYTDPLPVFIFKKNKKVKFTYPKSIKPTRATTHTPSRQRRR